MADDELILGKDVHLEITETPFDKWLMDTYGITRSMKREHLMTFFKQEYDEYVKNGTVRCVRELTVPVPDAHNVPIAPKLHNPAHRYIKASVVMLRLGISMGVGDTDIYGTPVPTFDVWKSVVYPNTSNNLDGLMYEYVDYINGLTAYTFVSEED